jgi:anti-sigma factor RsiW
MRECWDEGGLRAYLDRELPLEEMTRIAVHVGGCAECHARYNELAGRAARVAALMEALEVGAVASAPGPPPRHWTMRRRIAARPVATAVLALAAAAALAFVLLPKRAETPKPVVAPHGVPVRPVVQQAATPPVETPEPSPPRAKSPKREKPPNVQYYLALDDEPIDTGVVMRVALDGTGVQADVIFDADGRPRAIRTVK